MGVATASVAGSMVRPAWTARVSNRMDPSSASSEATVAEEIQPAHPERTMFRIGSISKLFNWTSLMQLVEQGKLDLNKDINEYLDWKIPATYPEPITRPTC